MKSSKYTEKEREAGQWGNLGRGSQSISTHKQLPIIVSFPPFLKYLILNKMLYVWVYKTSCMHMHIETWK